MIYDLDYILLLLNTMFDTKFSKPEAYNQTFVVVDGVENLPIYTDGYLYVGSLSYIQQKDAAATIAVTGDATFFYKENSGAPYAAIIDNRVGLAPMIGYVPFIVFDTITVSLVTVSYSIFMFTGYRFRVL